MSKIFVNLKQTTGDFANGWTASVAIARGGENSRNEIAIGESILYPNKELAWTSIVSRVQSLKYDENNVYFNYQGVHSFIQVEQLVALV